MPPSGKRYINIVNNISKMLIMSNKNFNLPLFFMPMTLNTKLTILIILNMVNEEYWFILLPNIINIKMYKVSMINIILVFINFFISIMTPMY